MFVEPGLDGGFEFGEALEHASSDPLAREFQEQALDEVEPAAASGAIDRSLVAQEADEQ